MTERMIEVDDIELCTEAFGDPSDPAVLLIMGLGASMLWWDEQFCRALAESGRFVIRYDHRDTGHSVSYEPGHPGYDTDDLDTDAIGVLDAYGIDRAHLVGVSAGGGIAQLLALAVPDRIRSLVLISTTPATPGDRDLPPPTTVFMEFVEHAQVAWENDDSVIDYLVDYSRVLAGDRRPSDEPAWRSFIRLDVERADRIASLQNHDVLPQGDRSPAGPLAGIRSPTLVVHGTADPMFPPAHGEALANEIPGAELLLVDGAGHGVFRADWDTIVPAIIRHTGPRTSDLDEGTQP